MLSSLSVIAVVALEAATPPAPGSGARIPRFTAEARIRRGRVRRARYLATNRALVKAVWRRLHTWVPAPQRTPQLRRRLARRVRRLIRRYRTKKLHRVGTTLQVTLAVTVDDAALKARLLRLGIRLQPPGVLLLAHCPAGDLTAALGAALRGVGVRILLGPWPPLARSGIAAAARGDARLAAKRALQAGARVAVVVTCRVTPARAVAGTGQQRRQVALRATLHVAGALTPVLWQVDRQAVSVAATAGEAERGALRRAVHRLSRLLRRELPLRLPDGPARQLRLRVSGGLPVPAQLTLAQRLAREISGVSRVTPARFARGESWFAVRTVLGLGALKRAVDRLTPPSGWQWRTRVVRPAGNLDLTLTLTEEP